MVTEVIDSNLRRLMTEYLGKISETASSFADAIELLNDMRTGEARAKLAHAMKAEKEADNIRREIVDLLEEIDIDPEVKEDLFHMIKRLDLIADFFKEAARDLTIIPYLEVPAPLREGYEDLLNKVEELVKKVCEAVKALLDKDFEKASKLVDEIEALEEEADEINVGNRGKLVEYANQIKPYVLAILLHEFNTDLEEAADACEDAGDYIRALIVCYRKREKKA